MIPKKALLVCIPLAVAGGALVYDAGRRIGRLESDLARVQEAGRSEGASFLRTLQGTHAEAQLRAFDERRRIAVELTAARRDRFVGLFAVTAAALGMVGAGVLRRIAREIEEDRRLVQGQGPGPHA